MFEQTLKQVYDLHKKKSHDYAGKSNPYSNFTRSASLMEWFENSTDKAFVNLIGTKLARLAVLLSSKEAPLNESIEDSFNDLVTYTILWKCFKLESSISVERFKERLIHADMIADTEKK